jgi:hypothetical protein
MKNIRRFLHLSWTDRLLVIEAVVWLGAITLGLRVLPLLTLQRLLLKLAERRPRCMTTQRITWAVRTASHYVPKAVCLPQALTAQFLLVQSGYDAELQIGAARSADGKLEAHAWVTSESGILIGNLSDLDRFVPLSPHRKVSSRKASTKKEV